MAVKEEIVRGALIEIYIYVFENVCLLSEMILRSAETCGKLTALVCVLKCFFLKHLIYG